MSRNKAKNVRYISPATFIEKIASNVCIPFTWLAFKSRPPIILADAWKYRIMHGGIF